MYSKQEAALLKKKFWTNFGQYMKPVENAAGETINWVNYKTGIRFVFFRMDATTKAATIGIELREPDVELRQQQYDRLLSLKGILQEELHEDWMWQQDCTDDDGTTINRISTSLSPVNIFNESDWPAIISFFKPRIIALDSFWYIAKDSLLAL